MLLEANTMQFACANTEKSEKTKVTCASPDPFYFLFSSLPPVANLSGSPAGNLRLWYSPSLFLVQVCDINSSPQPKYSLFYLTFPKSVSL